MTVADEIVAQYRKGRSARLIAASLQIPDSDVRDALAAQSLRVREHWVLSGERRRQSLAAGASAGAAHRVAMYGDAIESVEAPDVSYADFGGEPSYPAVPWQRKSLGQAKAEAEWQLGVAAAAAFIRATGRRWPGAGRGALAPGGPTLLEWLHAQSRARNRGTLPTGQLRELQQLGYFCSAEGGVSRRPFA
jgi:hypothetical protein